MTEKNNIPYGFHYIDNDYLDYLAKFDPHIPKHDYEDEGHARKFYCGPVFDDTGISYFIPVSHQIKDMRLNDIESFGMNMKERGKPALGCLDFRFAVPCPFPQCLTPYEPKGHAVKQAEFCNKYKGLICNEAKATHQNILSGDYPQLTESSTLRGEAVENTIWDYEDILDAKKSQAKQPLPQQDTQPEKPETTSVVAQNNVFAQRLLKANTLISNIETPDNSGHSGLG